MGREAETEGRSDPGHIATHDRTARDRVDGHNGPAAGEMVATDRAGSVGVKFGAMPAAVRTDGAADRSGTRRSSLSFTLYREIDPAPRKTWLVRDFLGAGELSCLYGQPGAGKSNVAIDLACHVAAGREWFGHKVTRGGVLYVACERVGVVKRRMAAFKQYHDIRDMPLAVIGGTANLRSDPTDANIIIDYANRLSEIYGVPIVLVIIETINRVLAGGDENSSKDMGRLIMMLTALQEATQAHILTVHHMPVDGLRMRGHGSLLGACDTTVLVDHRGDAFTATIEKANDGPTGERLAFNLKAVELHRDAETDTITTAPVIVPTIQPIPERQLKLSLNERTMLGILQDGEPEGLTAEEWNVRAKAEGIGEKRRATLYDVRRKLEAKDLVVVDDYGKWRLRPKITPLVPIEHRVTRCGG